MATVFILLPCAARAQQAKDDTLHLGVKVIDSFTRNVLGEATVSLFEQDSTTILCERMDYDNRYYFNDALNGYFYASVPQRTVYVVRAVHEGYDTLYARVTVPRRKLGARVREWRANPLVMRKNTYTPYKLGEAVVTASRVAMVVKGDTIEYDARAFRLAEGSMLDNLLSMLPGMYVTASGQIYVNGKFVDKLLVNGRDFFNGNPRVALDNLPAYTVDKVKVYHQALPWEHLIDERNQADNTKKDYVVDVRLRREYSESWLANFELAGGSSLHGGWDGRYLARLFAMRLTDHSTVGLFGSVNNLGDNQSPGRKGEWKKMDVTAGERTVAVAGANLSVDWKRTETKLVTSFEVRHEDILTRTQTTSVQNADALRLRNSGNALSDNGQTDVKWAGDLSLKTRSAYIKLSPALSYGHNTGKNSNTSLQHQSANGGEDLWTQLYSRERDGGSTSDVWHRPSPSNRASSRPSAARTMALCSRRTIPIPAARSSGASASNTPGAPLRGLSGISTPHAIITSTNYG